MAERAEHLDPVVVLIEDEEPTMTLQEWHALLATREPVDLGMGAAPLLAEARRIYPQMGFRVAVIGDLGS